MTKTAKTLFWIPSLSDIIFSAVFIKLLLIQPTLLKDTDTGFHIRLGEFMLSTFSIPRQDIFIFPAPSANPWIMHSWITQVIMGGIHRWFGLVEKNKIHHSVVFVKNGTGVIRSMNAYDLLRNGINFDGDVVYAKDCGARNRALKPYFPGRQFYLYSREEKNPHGTLSKLNL